MRSLLCMFLLAGAAASTARAAVTVSQDKKMAAPLSLEAPSSPHETAQEKLLSLDQSQNLPREIQLGEEEPAPATGADFPEPSRGLPIPEPGTLAIFGAGLLLLLRKRSF